MPQPPLRRVPADRRGLDALRYREELEGRLGQSYALMRSVINQVRGRGKRIVFPEGDQERVLRAAAQLADQQICHPILLGPPDRIRRRIEHLGLEFEHTIVNPRKDERRKAIYAPDLAKRRARKGVTLADAERLLKSRPYFGSSMLRAGDADGMVGGVGRTWPTCSSPRFRALNAPRGACIVGCYVVPSQADSSSRRCDGQHLPDQRTLAEIAVQTSKVARRFGLEPRVAMLSFSNFGSNREQRSNRSRRLWPRLGIGPDVEDRWPDASGHGTGHPRSGRIPLPEF